MISFLRIGATRIHLQTITRVDYFPKDSKFTISQPHIVINYLPGNLLGLANNFETIRSDHPSFPHLMELFQFNKPETDPFLKIQ